jgi:hypothetical protein
MPGSWKMKQRYARHPGVKNDEYGTSSECRQAGEIEKKGFTVWSSFPQNTKYIDPSTKDFMINYRVENIKLLVEELEKEGSTILDAPSNHSTTGNLSIPRILREINRIVGT